MGEHIPSAAIREVMEETGSSLPNSYALKGIVSERLVSIDGELKSHFLIFVGDAKIDSFCEDHREGQLALFELEEILGMQAKVVPSDFQMFTRFHEKSTEHVEYHEAELIQDGKDYRLSYYREGYV